MRSGPVERFIARAVLWWWVFLITIIGLGGNGLLAVRAWQDDAVVPALAFAGCFIGCAVYCWRTFDAADEIRAIFKD
jgi:hypothetical protein